jgi:hypothetical protein
MKILRKLARKIEIIWDIDTLKVCVFNSGVVCDLRFVSNCMQGIRQSPV